MTVEHFLRAREQMKRAKHHGQAINPPVLHHQQVVLEERRPAHLTTTRWVKTKHRATSRRPPLKPSILSRASTTVRAARLPNPSNSSSDRGPTAMHHRPLPITSRASVFSRTHSSSPVEHRPRLLATLHLIPASHQARQAVVSPRLALAPPRARQPTQHSIRARPLRFRLRWVMGLRPTKANR